MATKASVLLTAGTNDSQRNSIDFKAKADPFRLKDGGKAGGHKWIQGAVKHPGALHRALGVPEGEKIPAAKLAHAEETGSPRVKKMVALAHTLKKMH